MVVGNKDKNLILLLFLSLWGGYEVKSCRLVRLCVYRRFLILFSVLEVRWGIGCYFNLENINFSYSNGFLFNIF